MPRRRPAFFNPDGAFRSSPSTDESRFFTIERGERVGKMPFPGVLKAGGDRHRNCSIIEEKIYWEKETI